MSEAIELLISRGHPAAVAIICGTALELLFGSRHSWRSKIRGVFFYSLYILGAAATIMTFRATAEAIGLRPLMALDLRPFGQSSIAGLLIIVLIPARPMRDIRHRLSLTRRQPA